MSWIDKLFEKFEAILVLKNEVENLRRLQENTNKDLLSQYRNIETKIDSFLERLAKVEIEQEHLKTTIAADVKSEVSATIALAEANTKRLRDELAKELLSELRPERQKGLEPASNAPKEVNN